MKEQIMRMGEYWRLHDDAALWKIDAAAVHLLSRKGCRIDHEGLLQQLEGAGCRVDFGARRCFLPERLIRDAVRHLGGKAGEAIDAPAGWSPRTQLGLSGSYPHLLDWPSGERRLATRQDVIGLARMGHMLEEFASVGRVVTCAEVEPGIEPLWTTLTIAETTDKPIAGGEIYSPEYIEPLVRMGEVLTGRPGDTSLVVGWDFFIAPLLFGHAQAECFLQKRRFGMPNCPGTGPISGTNGPVTIAGTVAIAVAELLAGWTLGYVVNPLVAAGGVVSSGSLDMRTATACLGSPEALLQDMTTVQVARRLYGIPVWAATSYVDAKRPGLEAVYQKMYPLLAAPLGTGLRMVAGGLLSAGQDYSPVQHLLDAEVAASIDRFWGGFEVSEETLALELIEERMEQPTTTFLDTDHTLQHYRTEQWYPRWFDRRGWQGEAERDAEQAMLARIDAYWKDAVRRYERPALDRAKLVELRRIYRTAERAILGDTGSSRTETFPALADIA
ncbi:MAG: trimethylamine methyltransferase family protein [Pseudomonadota bacterium]